jgi:uncharacterized protein (TIGR00369 family)
MRSHDTGDFPVELHPLRARLELIPIFETLRFSIKGLSRGEATLTVPYSSGYEGIFESYHGGMLMTLADTAACAAVLTLAEPDARVTTTDMSIRFLAACRSDASAHAKVVKFGRTLCPVSVDIFDRSAKQVAIAQVTYMRLNAIEASKKP